MTAHYSKGPANYCCLLYDSPNVCVTVKCGQYVRVIVFFCDCASMHLCISTCIHALYALYVCVDACGCVCECVCVCVYVCVCERVLRAVGYDSNLAGRWAQGELLYVDVN